MPSSNYKNAMIAATHPDKRVARNAARRDDRAKAKSLKPSFFPTCVPGLQIDINTGDVRSSK